MGTFLGRVGCVHIPECQQEIYQQRMLHLLREGGMMSIDSAEMFGKKVYLLHPPEPNDDGSFWFNYNYYENDYWEDAGMNHGHLFSNKVGYMQFCLVMDAALVLEECSSDAPCFADLREANIPHWVPLSWLKYLFGDELPLANPSLWETYELLKTEGRYEKSSDSWDSIFFQNAISDTDWMDILAVKTVEQGTETILVKLKEREKQTSGKNGGESESITEEYSKLLNHINTLVQLLGKGEDQLCLIMSYLTEADSEQLIKMISEENIPKALRRLPIMMISMPGQIIVKALAELYCRDFWELWSVVKKGYAYHLYREVSDGESQIIRPTSTEVYLHISPDDKLFCLVPNDIKSLTSETRDWMSSLRNRFESLRTKASFSDCLSFQRSMMETLSDAENRHAGIMAFRNMFYEFMSNWAQSEYQAMWLLFKEMVADGATCTKRLRQYLALLSNPPLRKEVFGI